MNPVARRQSSGKMIYVPPRKPQTHYPKRHQARDQAGDRRRVLAAGANRGNPKLESTYIQRNTGAPTSRQAVRIRKMPFGKALLFAGFMLAIAALLTNLVLDLIK